MDDARSALRIELRHRRAAISAATRIAAANAVAEHLSRMPAVQSAKTVAGYWAIGGELPLHALMARLSMQTRYCLPVLQPGRVLRFAPWRVGEAIVANRFGIPEPSQTSDLIEPDALDVALLPLLGFTRQGDRLGTGGGWYDRSFSFRRGSLPPPMLIGIGFSCQQIDTGGADSLRAQDWDVPLDAVVTEHELLTCPR